LGKIRQIPLEIVWTFQEFGGKEETNYESAGTIGRGTRSRKERKE